MSTHFQEHCVTPIASILGVSVTTTVLKKSDYSFIGVIEGRSGAPEHVGAVCLSSCVFVKAVDNHSMVQTLYFWAYAKNLAL